MKTAIACIVAVLAVYASACYEEGSPDEALVGSAAPGEEPSPPIRNQADVEAVLNLARTRMLEAGFRDADVDELQALRREQLEALLADGGGEGEGAPAQVLSTAPAAINGTCVGITGVNNARGLGPGGNGRVWINACNQQTYRAFADYDVASNDCKWLNYAILLQSQVKLGALSAAKTRIRLSAEAGPGASKQDGIDLSIYRRESGVWKLLVHKTGRATFSSTGPIFLDRIVDAPAGATQQFRIVTMGKLEKNWCGKSESRPWRSSAVNFRVGP